MRSRTIRDTARFYDGGLPALGDQPGQPPNPSAEPRILLERHLEDGQELFSLERRIAYLDRHLGEFLVPAAASFRTDLTSTPTLFTWLVPRTGAHLPAALLHDGLVAGMGSDTGAPYDASYVSSEGHRVDRVQADRIFRDAMADTGTGVVRRWIVWSAVTLASFFTGARTPWTSPARWRYRVAALVTILLVVWLGWCATADLFDVSWPGALPLPWMLEGPFLVELAGGIAGAVVVPAVLALAWGKFWSAGMICLIMLAVLLHVTIGLAVISAGYQLIERLVSGRDGSAR